MIVMFNELKLYLLDLTKFKSGTLVTGDSSGLSAELWI